MKRSSDLAGKATGARTDASQAPRDQCEGDATETQSGARSTWSRTPPSRASDVQPSGVQQHRL